MVELFDHLVGAATARAVIDDQFDFRRLLSRQIGRLFPIEDPADLEADDASCSVGLVAGRGEFARAEDRRQHLASNAQVALFGKDE